MNGRFYSIMRLFFILITAIFIGALFLNLRDLSNNRINGASVVNPPKPIESTTLSQVKKVNANWIAAIPYGFSRAGQSTVSYDHPNQWWGERTEGNNKLAEYAKEHGLKVMVKPHVWVMGQGWAGDFDLDTENDWKEWEKDYTEYIMHHATEAEALDVELFCVGTEYRVPAKGRPAFWKSLIAQVREVYKGKITYAANWDNYQNISWWDHVDYIGVDAYFPLVEGDHPSITEIMEGWKPIKQDLSLFSKKWNRPILFTEYGFQSMDGATGNHWEVDKSMVSANIQLQADAYEATFRVFENEDWWAGGFFWKWHFTSHTGDWQKKEWTPQNKPAAEVIARWYAKW